MTTSLKEDYAPPKDCWDEMLTPDRQLRPQWRSLVETLDRLGPLKMGQRWTRVRQLLSENGVTFNLHGDPSGLDRPWELDPLPLVLEEDEWDIIESGLIQRSRLLRCILEDLYQDRILLAQRWVPPELLFASPDFLRPCVELRVPNSSRPFVLSLDLGRGPDGRWHVLHHNPHAPWGCGYALENRLLIARMLPEFFKTARVRRLTPFFEAMRRGLNSFSANQDEPRVVLWTPGRSDETFFEQAYLAQFLGCPLVESADMTVRDNRVYVKLLDGLQPVHVLFRWLADAECDPLELPTPGLAGLPGLVQAVRHGNVVVANALGSSWASTPALSPYLEDLCHFFLGESMELPDVKSWWCGEPDGCAHVLANLERMLLRPTFSGNRGQPVFASQCDLDDLATRIRDNPSNYVAQELLPLSTTPVWSDGRLVPRHLVLRVFSVSVGDQHFVLPGGLSRVSPSLDSFEVSAARGGRSKDTWVLGPDRPNPAHFDSMEFSPQRSVVRLSRKNLGLPSRVADNLFWLGRYTERAENLARLRRVCLLRRLENAEAHEIEVLAGGSDHLSELLSTLNNIERLAGLVRDRLSKDSWRVLHALATPRDATEFESQQFLELLLSGLASFWGMSNETMTRSHDWRFLRIGKRLERAVRISSLLSRTLGVRHSSEERLLEALLEMLDSMRAYRQRYPGGLSTQAALDLVLADETNPRSVAFQLAELENLLAQLPNDHERTWANPEAKLLLGCLTDIRLADVVHLCQPIGQSNRRSHLLELTSGLSARLLQMSEAINRGYLTHLDASRQ